MEPIAAPNWLTIVGTCYLIFAFGFLAGSAGLRRGWGAPPEVRHQITDYGRRVLVFAAGITGLIGMLFQGFGQFVVIEHGTWLVLACLMLVPIVLAYVFMGDQMMDRHRRGVEATFVAAEPLVTSVRAPPARVPVVAVPATDGSATNTLHVRTAAE
jgi:hypothetical protein